MPKTNWQPHSMPHSRDEAIDACRWLRDQGLDNKPYQEQLVKALKSWCIPVAEMMSDQPPEVEGAWICALLQWTDSADEHDLKLKLREQFKWRRRQSEDESTLGGPGEEYPLLRYAQDVAVAVYTDFITELWVTQYVVQLCADIPQDSVPVYYRQQFGPLAAQGNVVYVHDWARGVPVNYLILKPGPAFRTEIVDASDVLGVVV